MYRIIKHISPIVLVVFFFTAVVGSSWAEIKTTQKEEDVNKVFISAESRVRRLAIKSENNRKLSGMIAGASGAALTVLGIYFSTQSDSLARSFAYLYIAEGLTFMGLGIAQYFIPTGIENDYINIKAIDPTTEEDKKERELLAEKSLKDRSEEAARGRMLVGVLCSGLGVLYLALGGSSGTTGGVLFLGVSAYSLLTKSEFEKEYEEYLRDKEKFGSLDWRRKLVLLKAI